MSISFFCVCGKRLRAHENMAGRRSMCPRCGSPVGIPALQPTHRDAPVGPVTYAERLRSPKPLAAPAQREPGIETAAPAAEVPVDLRTDSRRVRRLVLDDRELFRRAPRDKKPAAKKPQRAPRREWPSLPFAAWYFAVWLGLMMAGLSAGAILAVPRLLEASLEPAERAGVWAIVLVALIVPGYVCRYFSMLLASGNAGRGDWVRGGGLLSSLFALRCLAMWLACFLAGPVYFAAATYYYWLYCGDIGVLDVIILAELSAVTIGYWMFQLACVVEGNSWLDGNPVQVAALMHRLGRRAGFAVVAATALVLIHAQLFVAGAEALHVDGWAGTWRLCVCWVSAMVFGTCLCRWLSVACQSVRSA
jgi:hypothetical protein